MDVKVATTEAGTARVFLWNGDPKFIPVWPSSCVGDVDGFDACSPSDGTAPAWGEDMGGRLLGKAAQDPVAVGSSTLSLPIDATVHGKLAADSLVLVSFESASEAVNAWSFPVVPAAGHRRDRSSSSSPPTATRVVPGTVLNFRATDETRASTRSWSTSSRTGAGTYTTARRTPTVPQR